MTRLFFSTLILLLTACSEFSLRAPRFWPTTEGLAMYRLLHTTKSDSAFRGIAYTVSVDEYLTESEFKDIVCQVIRDHKPHDYRHLAILFQYRLRSFDGIETKEFGEDLIGRYRWTEGASHEFSLGIFVNSNGEQVSVEDRLRPFDHTAECPVNEQMPR